MSGDTGETTPNEEDGVMVMPIGRDVSVFDAGQVTQFTNDEKLLINLSWGSSSSSSADVDLDLSACLFDHQGRFIESVYFGNVTSTKEGFVLHTGDVKDATAADSEEVVIDLKTADTQVFAIGVVVNSYNGQRFDVNKAKLSLLKVQGRRDVEVGKMEITQDEQHSGTSSDAKASDRHHTGLLLCKIHREPGEDSSRWFHTGINEYVSANSFANTLPALQRNLQANIPDIKVMPNTSNIAVLAKGESIGIFSSSQKTGIAARRVQLGLGWDMIGEEAVDLDASCVMFDGKNKFVDAVFFNKLKSKGGAVVHSGDNLTGEGEGDDELISIDFSKLGTNIKTLYFVVNSYTGHKFSRIKHAYVRLCSEHKELMRFSLSQRSDNAKQNQDHTAMLMCKLYKNEVGDWHMKGLGCGGVGAMYKDNLQQMQKELAGRLDLGSSFKLVPFSADAGLLATDQKNQKNMKWSFGETGKFIALIVLFFALKAIGF